MEGYNAQPRLQTGMTSHEALGLWGKRKKRVVTRRCGFCSVPYRLLCTTRLLAAGWLGERYEGGCWSRFSESEGLEYAGVGNTSPGTYDRQSSTRTSQSQSFTQRQRWVHLRVLYT